MKTIRLLSWNVNGIRAAQRKGFLDWMGGDVADILCVQETKAAKEQLTEDLQNVEGYHTHYVSAEKKGYSGVALYSRIEPLDVQSGMGIDRFDSEGRIIAAEYPDFTLFGVYFPNGQASQERLQYKMDFYGAFLDHIDKLVSDGKNVVVCGDVNTAHKPIDLARPKANETVSGFLPEERAWIDTLLSHGYVDTLRAFNSEPEQYSWWSMRSGARARNVGWRLDYFFVNEAFMPHVKSAFILPDVMGSDHCPVGIEIEL